MVAKVKEVTEDSLHHAFDGFSSDESQVMSVEVLGPGQGHVVVALPHSAKATNLRADVKVESLQIRFVPLNLFTVSPLLVTSLYSIFGTEWRLRDWRFPPSPEDKAQMVELMSNQLPELVKEGKLLPQPFKLWPGGLDGVRDGMKYMEEGKVSFEKVVFRFSA